MRVIVADKDPYDLAAYKSAIEASDVRVITATDGAELERLVAEQLPDVVVVASSLGHMGGFACSRDLKTMQDTGVIPQIKVLVLLEREADAWLAAWSRCDAYLVKPIEPDEVARVTAELGGTRAGAA